MYTKDDSESHCKHRPYSFLFEVSHSASVYIFAGKTFNPT